jgi:hypothetical protein
MFLQSGKGWWRSLRMLPLLALVFQNLPGQTPPVRELLLTGTNRDAAAIKHQNGHFILIHRGPTRHPGPADMSVVVLDASGQEIFSRNPGFDIPDISLINIRDLALTKDDRLVVAMVVWARNEQAPQQGASVLTIYKVASAELERIVRINPFACERLTTDEQNNIWCLGLDVEKRDNRQDYELVHEYSLDGRLLGQYFPRSLFPHGDHFGPQPAEPFRGGPDGRPQLVGASSGKVLALLPNVHELLEWDLEGNTTVRTALPGSMPAEGTPRHRWYTVSAMPDGTVVAFLSVVDDQPGITRGLFRFDRAAGSWELISTETSRLAQGHVALIGTDESGAILREIASRKLVWVPVPD